MSLFCVSILFYSYSSLWRMYGWWLRSKCMAAQTLSSSVLSMWRGLKCRRLWPGGNDSGLCGSSILSAQWPSKVHYWAFSQAFCATWKTIHSLCRLSYSANWHLGLVFWANSCAEGHGNSLSLCIISAGTVSHLRLALDHLAGAAVSCLIGYRQWRIINGVANRLCQWLALFFSGLFLVTLFLILMVCIVMMTCLFFWSMHSVACIFYSDRYKVARLCVLWLSW